MYNQYNLEATSLDNLLLRFKKSLLAEKISKGSVRSYLSDTRHFFAWLDKFLGKSTDNRLPITDHLKLVNQKVLETYRNSQIANNTPVKSINRSFSSLRRFGGFCLKQGIVNPFDTLRNIPEEDKPFPEEEYRLEEFKVQLWKNKASKLTIKNYLNDTKQFITWMEKQRVS